MILYLCPRDGRYILSFGILEAFGSLNQPAGTYVQLCPECSQPMNAVSPGDRLRIENAIEATSLVPMSVSIARQHEEVAFDDLVEITGTGRVESVSESGCLVRVHGVVVPFIKEQLTRIPPPPEGEAMPTATGETPCP